MTDFQLAMAVLGGIVVVFALALIAQSRNASTARGSSGRGTPKERIDIIGDEMAAIRLNQAEIAKRQAETDHHVAQMRTMMGALPSKDALHKLQVEVTELKGDLKAIEATTTATGRSVERILNYIIETKGQT